MQQTLLDEAWRAKLRLTVQGSELRVRGPRSAEGLARRLLASKGEVFRLLAASDPEVAWRVAAMLPQVLRRGPLPFLVARAVEPGGAGRVCASCGEPLDDGRQVRCRPCLRAAHLAIAIGSEEDASASGPAQLRQPLANAG